MIEKCFRVSGFLEASSYLLLLFVAMPLKYIWMMPIFVRWVGLFHGIFFILYCLAIVAITRERKWSLKIAGLAFLAAFLPFGPFIFERRYLDAS